MSNLTDINFWKSNLGLLPIQLFGSSRNNQFILLNGGNGDFCLNTQKKEAEIAEYFSNSWSSNTKNYVSVNGDEVSIYNWNRKKVETAKASSVFSNIDKFYNYLTDLNFKSDKDIVPFVVSLFKDMRNFTQEKNNAVEALNLLFLLLTTLKVDYNEINHGEWQIDQIDPPSNFDHYVKILSEGISGIKPEIDLIMRHSAGVLFQEAQKEVLLFDHQMNFWGGKSNNFVTNKLLYSSIHYTPPYLARTIVESSLSTINLDNLSSLKILDPACGSSEFLIEALKQLKEAGFNGDVIVKGMDTSEVAVKTSKFVLNYEKKTNWEDNLKFNIEQVDDSLNVAWDSDYDLILMNPPFVSWEQLSIKARETVREVLADKKFGRPNQASAFFYKALHSLKNDAAIGCVIPSSLLMLDSYQKLRESILDTLSVETIGKLGNYVFEDAFTDVSFFIGKKAHSELPPNILWANNEKKIANEALRSLRILSCTNENTKVEKDYSIYRPSIFPITKENWKPLSHQEYHLLNKIERLAAEGGLSRINDIFNVRQGIRTGNNSVFKISSEILEKFGKVEKKFFRPAIDNDAIKNGNISKSHHVWYPYDESGLTIKSEEELPLKAPHYYENFLKPNKDDLINRAGITEWWALTRPRNWQFKKTSKLVSTEFGKSNSFAFDKSGEFVVERGNAWIPKKEFSKEDFYFYLAIFSNLYFEKLLSIYSRQLAGGKWYDLGKKHTGKIPIPNVRQVDVRSSNFYDKLVNIGKDVSEGHKYSSVMTYEIMHNLFFPTA